MAACDIVSAVHAREVSAREIAAATLEDLTHGDHLRAFTALWPARALEHAVAVDRRVRAGDRRLLDGVPLAVKGTEGTASEQTRRLVAAGCVPVGATATPGPGTVWKTWGATDRGPTRNPHDPRWSPGGSSAGSAAAVAAGLVPLATGSDGAGSVRIPAAWCALLGLKLTGGLVPARDRAGLTAAGPLARTARDAAAYLDALTGAPTRSPLAVPTRPLRVTWSATLGFAATVDRVAATARARLALLADAGAVVLRDLPVELPDPAAYWSALRSGSAGRATEARRRFGSLHQELERVFATVDVLATPTTPTPPHGHEGPGETMSTALTWAFNISGHPAISLPAGTTAAGEPVGLQLVAPHGREADLLAVAVAAEESAAR